MMADYLVSGLPPGGGAMPWIVMIVVAAVAGSPIGRRVFSILGRTADALSRRPAVVVAVVALIAFIVAASISIVINFPEPVEHDEFSYLLAGQQLVKCRVDNPVHPEREFHGTSDVRDY